MCKYIFKLSTCCFGAPFSKDFKLICKVMKPFITLFFSFEMKSLWPETYPELFLGLLASFIRNLDISWNIILGAIHHAKKGIILDGIHHAKK